MEVPANLEMENTARYLNSESRMQELNKKCGDENGISPVSTPV